MTRQDGRLFDQLRPIRITTRSAEIQRLVGRSLRSAVDMSRLCAKGNRELPAIQKEILGGRK